MMMSYEMGNLNAVLAAAVGEDVGLIADLRSAFLDSARCQLDLLERARCDANWQLAAWRLKGLCASFGVMGMIALADEAEQAAPGDPRVLRRLRTMLDSLAA